MSAEHRAAMEQLMAQYQDALKQRENSLDDIARSMAELAASSKAQPGGFNTIPITPVAGAPAQAATASSEAANDALVTLAEEDQAKCTNCKTCYQDMSEIFEKTRVVIGGESREVARIIPGSLDGVEATPELQARIKRVVANCDAEIIQ